jgi:hypothetical protein
MPVVYFPACFRAVKIHEMNPFGAFLCKLRRHLNAIYKNGSGTEGEEMNAFTLYPAIDMRNGKCEDIAFPDDCRNTNAVLSACQKIAVFHPVYIIGMDTRKKAVRPEWRS